MLTSGTIPPVLLLPVRLAVDEHQLGTTIPLYELPADIAAEYRHVKAALKGS